jgi:L-iditol 2-dehydrogenase
VKIRVRNCSTCGTDVKILKFGHHHIVPPRVMGHEIAGEVAELGAGVSAWSVGDRVQIIAAIPCGQCRECLAGRVTVCPNQESMGYHYDGGFAEFLVIPAKVLTVNGVNRIPEGVSFAEASVAEPLACVLNGQKLARVGEGDDVVVVGSGPIGCLHVRLARARGPRGSSWSTSTPTGCAWPRTWCCRTRRSSEPRSTSSTKSPSSPMAGAPTW